MFKCALQFELSGEIGRQHVKARVVPNQSMNLVRVSRTDHVHNNRDYVPSYLIEWNGYEGRANFKGSNKDAKIYVGRSTTVHNPLFCAHTLWLNYVTETFLLVIFSDTTQNPLCFVHGQGQKSEQKHGTKNSVGLHNHFPLCLYCFRTVIWIL